MADIETKIVEDGTALAAEAANLLISALEHTQDRASVCLSGGGTPRQLYRLLAAPPLRDRIPWRTVHWFWGDERFVPPDNAESNYRMVREAMLDAAPVPPANIHSIDTVGLEPEQSAALYERTLKLWYGSEELDAALPLFDVTLLGLGEDGHTASLFPGTRALEEQNHWVTAVTETASVPRISLTFKALNASRLVLFLVAGANKKPALNRLHAGEDLPASHVHPSGRTVWLIDRAANDGASNSTTNRPEP